MEETIEYAEVIEDEPQDAMDAVSQQKEGMLKKVGDFLLRNPEIGIVISGAAGALLRSLF